MAIWSIGRSLDQDQNKILILTYDSRDRGLTIVSWMVRVVIMPGSRFSPILKANMKQIYQNVKVRLVGKSK